MDNLSARETSEALAFLLHHMAMETRHKMMACLPVTYVKLFPTTGDATLARVAEAIKREVS